MNKREQLMEYITQDIVAFLSEDMQLDYTKAMHQFYTSKTYEKLLDEETGLYLESSAFIYDIFKAERESGDLIQTDN